MRRKNRTKDYCVFCFFFFFLDGWDGQRCWHVTDSREGRAWDGQFGEPLRCSVLFMLLCFSFWLNLYIEAGLVYRTLSLQKDRAKEKDRNWGLFPSKCPNGVCMSLPQSPSLFCLTFSLLPVFDEEQLTFQSLKSSSEDKIARKPGGSSTGQPDSVHTKW